MCSQELLAAIWYVSEKEALISVGRAEDKKKQDVMLLSYWRKPILWPELSLDSMRSIKKSLLFNIFK